MENLPVDYFVTSMQFTARTHRDVYAAIDPNQAALSQKGKVIVVTGASQGLGARGFVPSFAAAGPKAIVLVARRADKLQEVADTIANSHPTVETLVVPTDIRDPAAVQALFEKVKQKYGHADVLVNNAAVFKEVKPARDADRHIWWEEMTINIHGTFLVTQQFLKQLPSPDTAARIITLTTGAAYLVFPGSSAYGISKLAVLELMAYVAVENPNVVAIALHPGIVDTEMTKEMFKRFALDTPDLVGGIGVWLAGWEGLDRSFLSGRFVASNWDVEDLVGRKDEIVEKELLKITLNAKLGPEQFK
ncbi:NAD(P)-binding protein [Didymella exigua CBS 183.55]|uniref:NAD(P)-binding protein n=1 Tax=Didymella exigua CBS 183.55 TaxID=1150837 RepID=A0A6A5RA23_9PLEO|nr:NAD(P)-binding protein [Didymella exigua CBS 183.55]KAF1925041.1 NAD(P)-binding protein [Didymella exigua CBS 183.55]